MKHREYLCKVGNRYIVYGILFIYNIFLHNFKYNFSYFLIPYSLIVVYIDECIYNINNLFMN